MKFFLLVPALILASANAFAGDLSGSCGDDDHSQFYGAKQFAVAADGLAMTNADGTRWALNYNNTHKCGTITEYKARYAAFFEYAKSSLYLNMFWNKDARDYALSLVESYSVAEANQWKAVYVSVRELFDSSTYLGFQAAEAAADSKYWNEHGCGSVSKVEAIKSRYQREFQFAYSREGLGYTYNQSKQYAVEKIKPMSPCGSLFH